MLSADADNFQQWRTTIKAAINAYDGAGLCSKGPFPDERALSKQLKFFLTRIVDQAWYPYIEDRECHEAWKSLMLLNPRTEDDNDRQVELLLSTAGTIGYNACDHELSSSLETNYFSMSRRRLQAEIVRVDPKHHSTRPSVYI